MPRSLQDATFDAIVDATVDATVDAQKLARCHSSVCRQDLLQLHANVSDRNLTDMAAGRAITVSLICSI